MLFTQISAFALFAASLVNAAPCTPAQAYTKSTLNIPANCTASCNIVAQAYSACTGSVGCTDLCSTAGINSYISCSNCVLNDTISVSQVAYSSIAAELNAIRMVCSASNISANATTSLVSWSFISAKSALNSTSTSSVSAKASGTSAAGINNVATSGAGINSVSLTFVGALVASAVYVLA